MGKARKGKVKVKVKLASAARMTTARLSRGGVTYARGRAAGAGSLRLRAVRPIPPGAYTLTTRITDRRGRTAVARQEVTVST